MTDTRLERILLWAEVYEVLSSYSHALDSGRIDDVVEMYLEDGVFNAAIGGEIRGRSALRTYYTDQLTDPAWEGLRGGQHLLSNVVVESIEGGARSFCDLIYVVPTAQGPSIAFLGRYEDELVSAEGTWFFKRRRTIETGK